ncbi:mannose-P-dolichol utilization defect 1 protein-like [Ischnura elegans]|uniref:mannose-P-dolichol utilization defect 1 protein-like n=1 Tax=Ischnura elegans TaxID=197161 RepID=UPI001ED88CF4|nr:mannose-P-dolichol utilization defect 1 protein-like [Ischnura elegans]XP_046402132.1 mannose-P-dolichol utilization defect 1 protein-like [Ischnura elegans]
MVSVMDDASGLLKNLSVSLFKEQCHDAFFVEFDFFNMDCVKIAVSKMLGIGIIAGSMLVKVPQILKIMSNKSAEGISISSVCMELFAITASLAYSFISKFPFSAWGEGLFLALQTCAIAALALFYGSGRSKKSPQKETGGSAANALVFVAVYCVMLYVLMSGMTSIEILRGMQASNVPLILLGKSIQAVANYNRQSTGQLSAVTLGLLFVGSLARIFTSIQETGDKVLVVTYMAASTANGVIFAQILYYGRKHVKSE